MYDYTYLLILTDDQPVFQQPRRLSVVEIKETESIRSDWLKKGIIQRSSSDYASPIVPVRKKDGTMRICVDYRRLNQKTVKDRYPIPVIEDQLIQLRYAKVFTTLDLKNGFHYVPVHEVAESLLHLLYQAGNLNFYKLRLD